MAVRIFLNGSTGRMGQAIQTVAEKDDDILLQPAISSRDPESVASAMADCDVVIDFTHRSLSAALAHACAASGKPLVMGTTGQTSEELEAIRACALKNPTVLASNFSVDIPLLRHFVREYLRILGTNVTVRIEEAHHSAKLDAPSGTAKSLAALIKGITGKPVPIQSVREGQIIGIHTVLFTEGREELRLTHEVKDRSTFAAGALRAARWVVSQPSGLYDMEDVLGLHKNW